MPMNPRLMRPLARFQAPPAGTPASLLLHFDGDDESTVFTDSSVNALTLSAYGTAEISTTQSKFGGSSGYFDGSALVTGPDTPLVAFGTGDFTVEAFILVNNPVAYGAVFSGRNFDQTNLANSVFLALVDGYPILYTDGLVMTASVAVANDTWTHVAWVRNNGTLKIFVDGAHAGEAAFATDITAENITVGGEADTTETKYVGYIDDLRITKGLAVYTGPFIPPTQQLSAYATPAAIQREAGLLLHFNGDDESTVFTDSSVNALTVTANGDAQISTAESKFGGASGAFNDTDAYLTLDYSSQVALTASSSFTVEAWIRPDATQTAGPGGGGSAGAIISTRNSAVYSPYELSIRDNLKMTVLIENNGNWQIAQESSGSVVADAWSHIALVNSNGSLTLYINGVADASISGLPVTPYTPAAPPASIYVGRGGDGFFNGYIDDLRLTPGLAVYQSPFTPPAAPLSAIATPQPIQASLLLHFDGTDGSQVFADSSLNNLSVTYTGDAELSDTQSKHGGTAVYLDGAGSTLEVPQVGAVSGAGDWTVEMWAYPSSPPFPSSNPYMVWLASDTSAGFSSALNDNGTVTFGESLVGTIGTTTNSVVFDEWNHIAWCRKNGVIKIFINGVQGASFSYATSIPAGVMRVGSDGGNPSVLPYVGYIDDLRVVRGLAVYTGPFVPPTGPLPALATPQPIQAQASLLLHFDGANGSTTFTDSSVNGIALTGGLDTELTTANFKHGTAAVALNSTSIVSDDTGIIPDMSAGDWTLEAWVWRPSGVSNAAILNLQAPGGGATGLHFWIGDDHQIRWDDGTQECAVGGSVPTEEWAHIAAVRFGGVTRLYLNGEQVGSESSIAAVAGPYTVFVGQHGGDDFFSDMLIDDLRVVRGLAVYTGPFVPPTAPLSATVTPL